MFEEGKPPSYSDYFNNDHALQERNNCQETSSISKNSLKEFLKGIDEDHDS